MGQLRWDPVKSRTLKDDRGVSFEEIIQAKLIAVMKHPAKAHQEIMLFEYREYIWVVPFVARGSEIFLKTLFPSRKYTKIYKRGGL